MINLPDQFVQGFHTTKKWLAIPHHLVVALPFDRSMDPFFFIGLSTIRSMRISHVHLQQPTRQEQKLSTKKRKRSLDRSDPDANEDLINAQHQFEQELRIAGLWEQLPMTFGAKPLKRRKKRKDKAQEIPVVKKNVEPLAVSHVQGQF